MFKCLRIVSVLILICFVAVNSNEPTRLPSLVDKLVSDYFETEKDLWSLINNDTENVLYLVEKRFHKIHLDGEADTHTEILFEDIKMKNYGDQISNIMSEIGYSYYAYSSIKNYSEINEGTIKARNFTDMLYSITSLDEFWDAALETAKVLRRTLL